jgi:hypothetical protein
MPNMREPVRWCRCSLAAVADRAQRRGRTPVLGLRVEVLYSRHALIFPKSGNFRKVTSVIRQTSTTQLNVQTQKQRLLALLWASRAMR